MTRIAVVGAGNLAEALLSGMLAAGHPAADLVFTGRTPSRADALSARLGVRNTTAADAVSGSTLVVIAVKPKDLGSALDHLGRVLVPGTPVASLCAGVPTAALERDLPEATPVVRIMPNTPMFVGEAMSAVSPGQHATDEHLAAVERMLHCVGRVVHVPEDRQDAATALAGSGPAYFFYLAEAMIEAGALLGLPSAVAGELVIQSASEAAELLRDAARSPEDLRDAVSTAAGTTTAATRELDRHRVRAALADAIAAAHDRSRELGR